ncbi:MAG: ABC transporter permease [Flavobacteriales bacterium]
MGKFIRQKLTYGLLVLWGVVTVVFFLFNLSPADPVRNLVGENAPEEVVQNIRRKLDLDLPLLQRYVLYLNDLSPLSIHNPTNAESRIYFDPALQKGWLIHLSENSAVAIKSPYLKRSFISDKSVSEILGSVIPGTVVLAVLSIALALALGLWLGIVAAQNKDTFFDRFILIVSALGMSGPSFFVAILVAYLGAILWKDQIAFPYASAVLVLMALVVYFLPKWKFIQPAWLLIAALALWALSPFMPQPMIFLPGTGLNMTGSLYSVDVWQGKYFDPVNMILPIVTLMIRPLAVIVQLTRSSMLEVMSQDYIRTARAKGLSEHRVIYGHALRNALNPVVTAVSGWFSSLLAGAVFVEFVFGWKGLGQEMFTAIEKQDLPIVMGGVIIIAVAFVVINLLVDLIYGWIDPRVRI